MQNLLIPVLFYAFAGLGCLTAVATVMQKNPVRSVFFLILTFFSVAAIWLLLSAEFLALILILVYVGAVMTLFLFVVMMLNIDTETIKTHWLRYAPIGLVIVAVLTGLLISALPQRWTQSPTAVVTGLESTSNTKDLGLVLYTDYLLSFEMAALILLVAIISAITLTHRKARQIKTQSIVDQLLTDPKDRLRLVKMKSENARDTL